jgi:hypothetical protein
MQNSKKWFYVTIHALQIQNHFSNKVVFICQIVIVKGLVIYLR